MRKHLLKLIDKAYQYFLRPIIFRQSAQEAHDKVLSMLTQADNNPLIVKIAPWVHSILYEKKCIHVGDVTLDFPIIISAGLVKGRGFATEKQALNAVARNINIIPGWRSLPALLGTIEFGSFTRHPRLGNSGTVVWRDEQTHSTQNRIGLRNPGVIASATFLEQHKAYLPKKFGINIAISPNTPSLEIESKDLKESIEAFLSRKVIPSWFTLNLSCPNTEDDPSGNQTEEKTSLLCQTALTTIEQQGYKIPLWVKISPDLSEPQIALLARIFEKVGVSAVIATNTLASPVPNNPELNAGVGGGNLQTHALETIKILSQYTKLDIIGSGGILNGRSFNDYTKLNVSAVQIWSALVFRGLFASAIIESESHD